MFINAMRNPFATLYLFIVTLAKFDISKIMVENNKERLIHHLNCNFELENFIVVRITTQYFFRFNYFIIKNCISSRYRSGTHWALFYTKKKIIKIDEGVIDTNSFFGSYKQRVNWTSFFPFCHR